ncbi:MAG: hypothetical protein IT174_15240 [Acidobacteria bacterium]|nr:hypothetical protein [Acidobacteriota bacterium]
MSQFGYKQFYVRNRPHIHPPDSVLFVTFRLAGSIAKAVVEQYRREKIWLEKELIRVGSRSSQDQTDKDQMERLLEFHRTWFARYESILDNAKVGPMWLGRTEIREIVSQKLMAGDIERYRLDAYSIMSNHAHIVFKPNISERNLTEVSGQGRVRFESAEKTLAEIMQGIKGSTARNANIALGRSGPFWERESYDHYVRNEAEFHRVIRYTLNNPVKAGLVKHWRDWPGNYLAPRLIDSYE